MLLLGLMLVPQRMEMKPRSQCSQVSPTFSNNVTYKDSEPGRIRETPPLLARHSQLSTVSCYKTISVQLFLVLKMLSEKKLGKIRSVIFAVRRQLNPENYQSQVPNWWAQGWVEEGWKSISWILLALICLFFSHSCFCTIPQNFCGSLY